MCNEKSELTITIDGYALECLRRVIELEKEIRKFGVENNRELEDESREKQEELGCLIYLKTKNHPWVV